MRTLAATQPRNWALILRLGGLCLLFLLQVEAVEIFVRRHFEPGNQADSIWSPFLAIRLYLLTFAVIFPAALLLAIWPRLRGHLAELNARAADHRWRPWLGAQLPCFAAFMALTVHMSLEPAPYLPHQTGFLLLWGGLGLATSALWLAAMAPPGYWRGLLGREAVPVLQAAAAALVVTALTQWLRGHASALSFAALHGADALLSLFYDDIVSDVAARKLGTAGFSVTVSNACSGFEGIALITVFLSVYLWLFRRELRFPQALLAYPLGIAVIWLFNVLRIAALIAIGDSVSAEVALAGFHSNAGWIAFILVSLGLLSLLHHSRWLQAARHPPSAGPQATGPMSTRSGSATTGDDGELQTAQALLLPFVVLLAATLLLGAFSAGFDLLYPLKVIAVGLAIWVFRGVYRASRQDFSWVAVAVGAGVFLAWLLLVPASAEQSAAYSEQFSRWSAPLLWSWIAFRCIGSVVTVPIAEELAFRGYLLLKLGGQPLAVNARVPVDLPALLASSLLFGLMHGAWLAGAMAGLAYGWLRYRRGVLADAVIGHMTTNGLLCAYVLLTGQWSYW